MKITGKLALTALMALGATAMQADDKVVVVTKNGQTAYDIDNVARIEFGDDALKVVETTDKGTTYAFGDVVKIVFTDDATAIDTPTAEAKAQLTVTISTDGNSLTVNGWDTSKAANLQLYSTAGASVQQVAGWNGQTVDISALPHGIYVVSVDGHTAKFRK